jgi:hypothetical protein
MRECSNECWKLKRCLLAMNNGMGCDSVSEIMEPQTVRGSLHPQILEDRIYDILYAYGVVSIEHILIT